MFEVTVPPAVEREILASNRKNPQLLYPQQALFSSSAA
jgi:hypothetical protein